MAEQKYISRSEAIKQGLERYFTGKPCKNGHISERFVFQYRCVACLKEHYEKQRLAKRERYWNDPEAARARRREYVKNNPEIVKEVARRQREGKNREKRLEELRERYLRNRDDPDWQEKQREYRERNKEKIRERKRKYEQENRERLNEVSRLWRKKNPEKRRIIAINCAAKRRALTVGGPSSAEVSEWAETQKKVCYWCGVNCAEDYHVDHYVPLARGGPHEISNFVIACPTCNYSKNAKDPYEFAQEVGRLF